RPSYSYEAIFTPLPQSALVGDRPQNNRAFAHVIGTGKRRVLFVEGNRPPGQAEATHALLIRRLAVGGQQPCAVRPIQAKELPVDKNELGLFLSNFDTVVLANVPAEELTPEQMEALRSNTYDQGCGLVMIGGPNSFGAGGYRQTAVEQALPVD